MDEQSPRESQAKPWEQQPDEPQSAYARFLVYCYLGPARSLDAAFRSANPIAAKRSKPRVSAKSLKQDTRRASGQWNDDSVKYNWAERATAFDIDTLTGLGQRVVVKYVNALDLAFSKIIAALQDEKAMPRSWDQILESLTTLGAFIPQETVATIRQDFADDSVPAFGAGSGEKPETA